METDRPITQPTTLSQQQALANAYGHGGCFHVTGSMHVTSDDLFISMEMNVWNAERVKLRRTGRKDCNSKQQRKRLLRYSSKVSQLTCSVLLIWTCCLHGIRRKRQRAIRADGNPPPAYERWADEDEQRLVALHATNTDISNMQYRREVVLKKRELEAAADHFNREERDKLQKKWDAMDAEDAEEAITSLQEEFQAEVTDNRVDRWRARCCLRIFKC